MKKITTLLATVLVAGSAHAQCNPDLKPAPTSYTFSGGVNGNILCSLEWDPDGVSGPMATRLVVGGTFTNAEGGSFNHIAMFNGTAWEPLWTGMNGDVLCLAIDTSDNTLLAGGKFTTAGGVAANKIARYSNTTQRWTAIGSGVSGTAQINCIHYDSLRDDIYIGGNYVSAGGANTGALARIHGTTYSTVVGNFPGTILAFGYEPTNRDLYIGGQFDAVPGSPNLVRLNILGLQLFGVNAGCPGGGVYSFARFNEGGVNKMAVGGSFGAINGVTFNSIAQIDENGNMSPMDRGVAGWAYSLSEYRGQLTVVGAFQLTGRGAVANRAAQWNGQSWQPMETGLDSAAYTCTPFRGALYVGGQFISAGSATVSRLAMWDQTHWSAPHATPTGKVLSMITDGVNLIIGGSFDMRTNNGTSAHNIVRYGASGYTAYQNIGGFNGLNGRVNALNLKSNGPQLPSLYAGGSFTTAGGNPASNLAVWNGFDWAQVSDGVNGPVYGIATYGCTGTINQTCGTIAVGSFTASGTDAVNNIVRFGPGAVSKNLGSGLNGPGYCLLNYGGNLLVGGLFTTAGGIATTNIAQWNGTNWSKFNNTVLNGAVNAMAVFNGDLIIAGDFTTVNGTTMINIARWNGSSWFRMDSATPTASGAVTSLAVHEGKLYAGGYFVNTLGNATTLARWDGGSWEALISEPNGTVQALSSAGGKLWTGGTFSFVGDVYSPFLAAAECPCYVNCDNSTAAPTLNINDFQCFLNQFALGAVYANCDGSTATPVLNVNDFQCFLNKFAVGCQ